MPLHDLFASKGTHADLAWPSPNFYLHQMCPQHEEKRQASLLREATGIESQFPAARTDSRSGFVSLDVTSVSRVGEAFLPQATKIRTHQNATSYLLGEVANAG